MQKLLFLAKRFFLLSFFFLLTRKTCITFNDWRLNCLHCRIFWIAWHSFDCLRVKHIPPLFIYVDEDHSTGCKNMTLCVLPLRWFKFSSGKYVSLSMLGDFSTRFERHSSLSLFQENYFSPGKFIPLSMLGDINTLCEI